MCNGLESDLNQSSMTQWKCSAVENVSTLTYLNNKHFHRQVCWLILTQYRQHTIKDRNSNIINNKMSRRVQCTRGFGGIFSQQFKRTGPYAGRWYACRTPKGEMNNEFGEIPV